jgi:hypothetical protein
MAVTSAPTTNAFDASLGSITENLYFPYTLETRYGRATF